MTLDRAKLLRLMGELLARVALAPKTLETVDCGAYTRELVEYAVEPHERIKAYFLLPKTRSGKVPPIFCHHQHNAGFHIGKREFVGLGGHPDQALAAELLRVAML